MPDSYLPVDEPVAALNEGLGRKRKPAKKLRKFLSCRHLEVEDSGDDLGVAEFLETLPPSPSASQREDLMSRKRATLTMRTKRQNEPIMRITQGSVIMKNLELRHICHGLGTFDLLLLVPFSSNL